MIPASWFFAVKTVHVCAVTLSFALFVTRGVWVLRGSARMQRPWVKVVPHVNDTVLLASGVLLAAIIHQYPGTSAWLTAKLVGLIVYILLGMAAFRWARSRPARGAFWLAAQGVFLYIVAVAVTQRPIP
ncbi:MAG TPA: SirB2 family protein [Gammaproteobacteria bacterium]|nr:SirB2 family protein [Gammaproteobacteria bacterium]